MKKYFALLILIGSPIFTVQAKINTHALEACSLIENDLKRLVCYDKIIAGQTVLPIQPNSTQPKMASQEMVKNLAVDSSSPVTSDDFGLEHKEAIKDQAEGISAKIVSVKQAPYGELIITLDNKQQWRQIGSDSLRLKENDTIEISRGVFNSFLLKKVGNNRTIRVKRTQ